MRELEKRGREDERGGDIPPGLPVEYLLQRDQLAHIRHPHMETATLILEVRGPPDVDSRFLGPAAVGDRVMSRSRPAEGSEAPTPTSETKNGFQAGAADASGEPAKRLRPGDARGDFVHGQRSRGAGCRV